jgi:membrane-associated phospholipid phosphatase
LVLVIKVFKDSVINVHGSLEVTRKASIGFVIVFFLFSTLNAQSQELGAQNSEEGNFTAYFYKTLPKNLLIGTKNSFLGWNLAILGAGAGGAIALSQTGADNDIQEDVKGVLGNFADIGNIGGSAFTLAGVALSTYAIGIISKNKSVVETGRALIEAEIITAVMTSIIKVSVGRERPDGSGNRISSSFPSGHVSGSFALASTIDSMYGHYVGVPLYLFAGYVGFSRVSDNKHFLSDVIFGAALGTAIGRGVAKIHKNECNRKFHIVPYADGNGAGLLLTLSW